MTCTAHVLVRGVTLCGAFELHTSGLVPTKLAAPLKVERQCWVSLELVEDDQWHEIDLGPDQPCKKCSDESDRMRALLASLMEWKLDAPVASLWIVAGPSGPDSWHASEHLADLECDRQNRAGGHATVSEVKG